MIFTALMGLTDYLIDRGLDYGWTARRDLWIKYGFIEFGDYTGASNQDAMILDVIQKDNANGGNMFENIIQSRIDTIKNDVQEIVNTTDLPNTYIQQSLNTLSNGTLNLAVDGIIGPQTIAAIKLFQQAHSLAVDGIVGPNTKEALLRAMADYEAAKNVKPLVIPEITGTARQRLVKLAEYFNTELSKIVDNSGNLKILTADYIKFEQTFIKKQDAIFHSWLDQVWGTLPAEQREVYNQYFAAAQSISGQDFIDNILEMIESNTSGLSGVGTPIKIVRVALFKNPKVMALVGILGFAAGYIGKSLFQSENQACITAIDNYETTKQQIQVIQEQRNEEQQKQLPATGRDFNKNRYQ